MTLQEWMDAKGWNDKALASEVKVLSRSQISRIRRGKCVPSVEKARRLEEVTQIPAAVFVMGEAGT